MFPSEGSGEGWRIDFRLRILRNLQKLPILILTAETSYHAPYDHCTVKYLDQAGVHPCVDQKNNIEIGRVISRWLAKNVR